MQNNLFLPTPNPIIAARAFNFAHAESHMSTRFLGNAALRLRGPFYMGLLSPIPLLEDLAHASAKKSHPTMLADTMNRTRPRTGFRGRLYSANFLPFQNSNYLAYAGRRQKSILSSLVRRLDCVRIGDRQSTPFLGNNFAYCPRETLISSR
jgi:hypothetical protein